MSRALGLVKFNKTGNIYMGVYNGTSDVFCCRIFKPEDCKDSDGKYRYLAYYDSLKNTDVEIPPNDELDSVEIYSDYGDGFYWSGKGNEDYLMISPFSATIPCYKRLKAIDGIPKWAEEFMREHFKSSAGE